MQVVSDARSVNDPFDPCHALAGEKPDRRAWRFGSSRGPNRPPDALRPAPTSALRRPPKYLPGVANSSQILQPLSRPRPNRTVPPREHRSEQNQGDREQRERTGPSARIGKGISFDLRGLGNRGGCGRNRWRRRAGGRCGRSRRGRSGDGSRRRGDRCRRGRGRSGRRRGGKSGQNRVGRYRGRGGRRRFRCRRGGGGGLRSRSR